MNNILKSHDITIALIDIDDGVTTRFDTIHWHGYNLTDEEVENAVIKHIELLDKYCGADFDIIEIIR